jgi:hypothetical protein
LAIVGAAVTAGVAAIHVYQTNAWWDGSRGEFHFAEDLEYAKGIDKLGHFYGASVLTWTLHKSLRWANVSEPSSLYWGAVGSTAFQTYVEIEDGFATAWGFDRVDFAANLLGAWYPVLQYHVPFFQNLQMRFSYWPKNAGAPSVIPGQTHTMFDDYEGQTFWLALRVDELLPRAAANIWPDWLMISGGVAVRDNATPDRYLSWYLAPDLDWTEILPEDSSLFRTLSEALNFIHAPMPAVQIAPGVVWYGLYF